MAPPSRLRPHLNDLLQKNHDLEHTVADLRHQLTQSSAEWADERKDLAVGCDVLMASFAKFRARLDTQPSDWGDSEEEQNRGTGAEGEGGGDAENGETESDQRLEVLEETCRTLASELKAKEEELEESQRKREATEEEWRRVEGTLQAQIEQLQAALASARASTAINPSPNHGPNDISRQADLESTGLGSGQHVFKAMTPDQEISRIKLLLQQWQKYGNDWKRDAQAARSRVSELELREKEFNAWLKQVDNERVLLERERNETQRLENALADQTDWILTPSTEYQKTARQEVAKRVNNLEATMALLRAQIPPEQLATFDATQNQTTPGQSDCTEHRAQRANPDADKPHEMIVLRIPLRPARKSFGENSGSAQNQENHTAASAPVGPLTPENDAPSTARTADYEVCIHTCNPFRCRNESRSFLWLRKRSALPRHALSTKRHHSCTPDCPGHRLLTMSVGDAMNEPRRAKCRPPSEVELALAAEEASHPFVDGREGEQDGENEGENEGANGREDEGVLEEGSRRDEEEPREDMDEEHAPSKGTVDVVLGKRLRPRHPEGDESLPKGDRKLRPRPSKP
ncbi:hypothetical protein BS17DRAFT_781818 [Gyrodon lividus]|nr:hypothetical protein BS17DRAFT_781818 [Gyrodon lividus]